MASSRPWRVILAMLVIALPGPLACGEGAAVAADSPARTIATKSTPTRTTLPSARTTPPPPPTSRPAPAPAPDPLRPLTDSERTRLLAGPHDAPIPVEIHYVQSNETRHDLFFPLIEGIGGAFVGVGSDQSFTMAAVARAELLFVLDIDQRVVDLHQIYAVLIPEADDPEALVQAFARDRRDDVLARLHEAFADRDAAERRRMRQAFTASRETVLRHLRRVLERTVDGEPASWLSDPARFAHIQRLYRAGRVRVLPGDLTGTASLRTIAEACRDLDVPVRALYMSNAEEFFLYTPDFEANLRALPLDERSVVLRTLHTKRWTHADLWAYQVQPVADLLARVADDRGGSRKAMLRIAEREGAVDRSAGPRGLSVVGLPRP